MNGWADLGLSPAVRRAICILHGPRRRFIMIKWSQSFSAARERIGKINVQFQLLQKRQRTGDSGSKMCLRSHVSPARHVDMRRFKHSNSNADYPWIHPTLRCKHLVASTSLWEPSNVRKERHFRIATVFTLELRCTGLRLMLKVCIENNETSATLLNARGQFLKRLANRLTSARKVCECLLSFLKKLWFCSARRPKSAKGAGPLTSFHSQVRSCQGWLANARKVKCLRNWLQVPEEEETSPFSEIVALGIMQFSAVILRSNFCLQEKRTKDIAMFSSLNDKMISRVPSSQSFSHFRQKDKLERNWKVPW